MSFAKEFRDFAMKGNVVDMAVGIIIGAAFGKIVSSLVADVIMPPIGIIVGGVDFTSLAFVMKPATATTPAVVLKYGVFLQTVVDFLIVAASVFLMVKAINKLKRGGEEPAAAAPVPAQEQLLSEIRDLLKAQSPNLKKTAN